MRRTRTVIASAAAAAALAAVAGCGGGGGGATAAPAGSNHGALTAAHKAGVGSVLVDSQGRTLYRYTPDQGTMSTCTGSCARLWPPALAPASGKPRATGVHGMVGTTTRAGGQKQLTFDGHPLYRYVGDTSKADAKGQGIDHIWFVLPARGGAASSAPASSTPAPSSVGY